MAAVTDIDRQECQRVVPMRVLALGLHRTGTECMLHIKFGLATVS